jgi:hypothetical protein
MPELQTTSVKLDTPIKRGDLTDVELEVASTLRVDYRLAPDGPAGTHEVNAEDLPEDFRLWLLARIKGEVQGT